MNATTFSEQEVSQLTAEDVKQMATRLEEDNYTSPFECLRDWHLLRAVAFQRPELVEPYLHLLDLEVYDES
ncbi:hypothetical protein BST81_14130 [Leptolyngbya sp. 'hensonii']|nr:DUF2555 domain-containing protein [Leptolyngbya sp. 'hensonii']OLP18151.1 hypothetical protein BST81_14130 [Leptolyngbya sp. 'hensonii']